MDTATRKFAAVDAAKNSVNPACDAIIDAIRLQGYVITWDIGLEGDLRQRSFVELADASKS